MSEISSSKFVNAAHNQARNYDRRFRKYVPFGEITDTLRRHAAYDLPLKFVLDRNTQSSSFFKRGPLWDFGNAGVRFEKKEMEGSQPALVVTWNDDFEQKTLQVILEELKGLGFDDDTDISVELVSPSGERKMSQFGVGVKVDKVSTIIHFTGDWQ